ncbi:hypothetical protein LPJ73_004165, partial [Coemansia sp. RSA 2703]
DCGILHRDISTNNILVVRENGDSSGTPRGLLIDFDFAIKVDNKERKARAERSGTLPYMSIANLLNLDCERTALDDWESLLYIVCWLATIGINSKDRDTVDLTRHRPIFQWNDGLSESIADCKRTHMHSDDNFKLCVVKHFCEKYKLLKYLARHIHNALFANAKCRGAIDRTQDSEDLDLSDFDDYSGAKDRILDNGNDPIVKRNQHVDEIVNNLESVFEKIIEKHTLTSQKTAST